MSRDNEERAVTTHLINLSGRMHALAHAVVGESIPPSAHDMATMMVLVGAATITSYNSAESRTVYRTILQKALERLDVYEKAP